MVVFDIYLNCKQYLIKT